MSLNVLDRIGAIEEKITARSRITAWERNFLKSLREQVSGPAPRIEVKQLGILTSIERKIFHD